CQPTSTLFPYTTLFRSFQEAVQFHQLGLTIIDEQHRFGVHQRLALREKGRQDKQVPHQLVLTATPIPRTLAMSLYGDLDTSVIRSEEHTSELQSRENLV